MNPTHKTSAILVVAGLVAAGSAIFLSRGVPAVEPAKPVAQAPAQDSSGLLLQTRMQSSHVLAGVSETHMAVTIQAPFADQARVRPPVNLAIVIDRSGSMAGDKLANAKAAARQLISQLRPTDRFALVTYGTDVSVVFSSQWARVDTKSAAYQAIDRIYDDGGTNLSGGLVTGRDEIMRHLQTGAVDRIVLISDGLANEGIVNRDALAALATETAQRGVSITTVGVGLDFDERTMTGIAVNGRGNYYFAESSAMLTQMFTDELGKLGATTATRVRLSLNPGAGIDVLEAYGYPLQREGSQYLIPVADLYSGETRKVVLRLRVDTGAHKSLKIADVGVTFHPVDSLKSRTVSAVAKAEVTGEQVLVRKNMDRDAVRHIERARTAKVINEATLQYEAGNAAAAKQMIQVQRQQVLELAGDLGDEEFAQEIEGTTRGVDRDFAEAPAVQSKKGKRARKANRKKAYDLLY